MNIPELRKLVERRERASDKAYKKCAEASERYLAYERADNDGILSGALLDEADKASDNASRVFANYCKADRALSEALLQRLALQV